MAEKLINLNGDREIFNNLTLMKEKLKIRVIDEVKAATLNLETSAKRDCPVDFGTLRQSIYKDEFLNGSNYVGVVGSDLKYAPYVEFGTGGFVSVPVGYEDFAMQFKGSKTVIGMNAQPYLIPNFEVERERVKQAIKNLMQNVKS